MTNHKDFFLNDVPELLSRLEANAKPLWGVINATQMADHILAGTRLFLSKTKTELETPEELLPKYKVFLMSDRGFKESAKKPDEYEKYEGNDGTELEELKTEFLKQLLKFEEVTATEEDFWSFHPSFGMLNAEETRQLQFKHIRHHFRQFGLME